jgi:hypothetical protein
MTRKIVKRSTFFAPDQSCLQDFIENHWKKKIIYTPEQGLEPWTVRLKA